MHPDLRRSISPADLRISGVESMDWLPSSAISSAWILLTGIPCSFSVAEEMTVSKASYNSDIGIRGVIPIV